MMLTHQTSVVYFAVFQSARALTFSSCTRSKVFLVSLSDPFQGSNFWIKYMKIEGGHEQKILLKMLFFWFCFVFLIVSLYNWHFLGKSGKISICQELMYFLTFAFVVKEEIVKAFL